MAPDQTQLGKTAPVRLEQLSLGLGTVHAEHTGHSSRDLSHDLNRATALVVGMIYHGTPRRVQQKLDQIDRQISRFRNRYSLSSIQCFTRTPQTRHFSQRADRTSVTRAQRSYAVVGDTFHGSPAPASTVSGLTARSAASASSALGLSDDSPSCLSTAPIGVSCCS